VEIHRPARLDALTGLRCFAAVNIVLFHFSNPDWFNFSTVVHLFSQNLTLRLNFAPVVNAGYASVSFFILLSGFVLAYNYGAIARAGELERGKFWKARFTRLYPIYLLGLILSLGMLHLEYSARSRGFFWTGVVLTPLLLQGWVPMLATFWNTPAWTMSAESFFYVLFPWLAKWQPPKQMARLLAMLGSIWFIGLIPGALYIYFNPDGIAHPDRWSSAPWLVALKFTPLPHLASFVFGVALASLDARVNRDGWLRLVLGLLGFAAIFGLLELGPAVPYPLIHDGLLMPLFGCIILGLAGRNQLSWLLSAKPLVFVGEASYCMYLLHFNLWNLIHDSHILNTLHLGQFDPWISYLILIALAILALHYVEKPAQKLLRRAMHAVMPE
jgi:peptidoglycan/LPS O-acetylase OafA/YrhL